ncbi:hypothetical protein ACFQ0Q_37590 [Streptomyces aureus]
MPVKGNGYYTPAAEALRRSVNDWIRTGGAFDGVIDFDRVMRDPADPRPSTPPTTPAITYTPTTRA